MKMLGKALVMLIVLAVVLIPVAACRGTAGEQGLQGPQGEQGPAGEQGFVGPEGPTQTETPPVNTLGELYQGDGYAISYPQDWFLLHISPEEIRLTPPTDSSGGLIAIRATHDGFRVGSGYYSSPALALIIQENLLRDYSKTMGIDISEVQYNGPVIRGLRYYEDWNWVIHFNGVYRGENVFGYYLIRDSPPTTSYTYLEIRHSGGVGWTTDAAFWQFVDIFRSFRFINVE